MEITRIINGKEYKFGSIKLGVGRHMKVKYPDAFDHNVAFVAESLKQGGMAEATPEWVDENVNFYTGEFSEFVSAAFAANGIKVEIPKPGGEAPPVEAAE
jgi:hypothetical protein